MNVVTFIPYFQCYPEISAKYADLRDAQIFMIPYLSNE